MEKTIVDQLEMFCDEGTNPYDQETAVGWSTQVKMFLATAIGREAADEFFNLRTSSIMQTHARRLGYLQGVVARARAELSEGCTSHTEPVVSSAVGDPATLPDSRRVFIVHGHDNEAKEGVARFLEKLDLHPIILHEQPSEGQTVIEKFEKYSGDIAFAVVLLTSDDMGADSTAPENLKPRARQNVVLELGYFMGRLGRTRVCALCKGAVELPSDYHGILYIEMDETGAWKTKLAQEFVQANLPIVLSGLLGG